MAKPKSVYVCTTCSHSHPKWVGRCISCEAWGTVEEQAAVTSTAAVGLKSSMKATGPIRSARELGDVTVGETTRRKTGYAEFDRVLGGGLVTGSVALLAAEPGFGKSTLLLGVAVKAAEQGRRVLYVSGEESAEQIKVRADRLGMGKAENVFLASESDLNVVLGHIEEIDPGLVIVDSIQTIASPAIEGRMGGVSQIVEVAGMLTRWAKGSGVPLVLVGQMTKNDEIGGPRALEHLVDVVVVGEGDKHSSLRMLRAVKNRFGSVDEIGCFTHTAEGLVEVPDPSGLFVGDRENPVPGTCVGVVLEGRRPLLAEVQALVAASHLPVPRRGCSGLDSARLAMTLAVTERHGSTRLFDRDVYVATVGGVKIVEPAVDLAVVLAVAGAAREVAVRGDVVAIGEVALSGDVRQVPEVERRVMEAGRLGFRVALVPVGTTGKVGARLPGGLRLVEVPHVTRAVEALAAMQPAAV